MLASRPTPNRLALQKETHHSEIARRRKSLACGPSGNSTQTQENAWQGSTRLDQTSWLCTWLASTERIGSTKRTGAINSSLGGKRLASTKGWASSTLALGKQLASASCDWIANVVQLRQARSTSATAPRRVRPSAGAKPAVEPCSVAPDSDRGGLSW